MAVSRGARTAWIVVGSIFTVVTLGFGTVQAVSALAHEERTRTTTIRQPVRAVVVVAAGSVRVIGTDEESVTITETISDGLQRPSRSTEINQGVLYLRGTCPGFPETFCRDDFVLRVPRSASLTIDADGIRVAGVRGGLRLTSDGGDIDVRGATGELWLRSHGGSIDARNLGVLSVDAQSDGGNTTLAFRSPPRLVDAGSSGGHIHLVLPEDSVSYRVDASAQGGSTDTSIRTDPESRNEIHAASDGGGIVIRYPRG